jgi:hypothetical protein
VSHPSFFDLGLVRYVLRLPAAFAIVRRNLGAQIAKLRAHRNFGPAPQEKLV